MKTKIEMVDQTCIKCGGCGQMIDGLPNDPDEREYTCSLCGGDGLRRFDCDYCRRIDLDFEHGGKSCNICLLDVCDSPDCVCACED